MTQTSLNDRNRIHSPDLYRPFLRFLHAPGTDRGVTSGLPSAIIATAIKLVARAHCNLVLQSDDKCPVSWSRTSYRAFKSSQLLEVHRLMVGVGRAIIWAAHGSLPVAVIARQSPKHTRAQRDPGMGQNFGIHNAVGLCLSATRKGQTSGQAPIGQISPEAGGPAAGHRTAPQAQAQALTGPGRVLLARVQLSFLPRRPGSACCRCRKCRGARRGRAQVRVSQRFPN